MGEGGEHAAWGGQGSARLAGTRSGGGDGAATGRAWHAQQAAGRLRLAGCLQQRRRGTHPCTSSCTASPSRRRTFMRSRQSCSTYRGSSVGAPPSAPSSAAFRFFFLPFFPAAATDPSAGRQGVHTAGGGAVSGRCGRLKERAGRGCATAASAAEGAAEGLGGRVGLGGRHGAGTAWRLSRHACSAPANLQTSTVKPRCMRGFPQKRRANSVALPTARPPDRCATQASSSRPK